MSATNDVLNLKVDVLGEEEFDAALEKCEQAIEELDKAFLDNSITLQQWVRWTERVEAKAQEIAVAQSALMTATMKADAATARAAATQAVYTAAAGKTAMSLDQVTAKFQHMETAAGKAEAALSKSGKGLKSYQQSITAGGYAMQDFASTSGDMGARLNSITNNLPALLSGFGQWGMIISTVAVAGVALYRNWDAISSMWQERHPFPKQADEAQRLSEELNKVNKELGDLKERSESGGGLSSDNLAKAKRLMKEQERLEDEVELQKKLDALSKRKSEVEEDVVKAFEEAMSQSGPKEQLAKLRADLGSSQVPALKKLFSDVFLKIEAGSLDALRALIEHTKTQPDKYKELTKALEIQLKEKVFKGGGFAGDEMVKEWREHAKKETAKLNEQGLEGQLKLYEDIGKEMEKGVMGIVKKPMEALIVKARINGITAKQEMHKLRGMLEEEVKELFPELAEAFPNVVKQVAAGMQIAVGEAVDKSIEVLQEMEGLTKDEALRRLRQAQQEKGQGMAEALALDELKQAAARNLLKQQALRGGPAVTPEMAAEQAKAMQEQMKEAGVSPLGQVQIGKAMNLQGGQEAIARAMDAMMQQGFDEAAAMRQLPMMLDQMLKGRQAQQAAQNQAQNQIMKDAAAAQFEAGEAARPVPEFKNVPRKGMRSVPPEAPDLAAPALNAQAATQQAVFDAQQNMAILAGKLQSIEANNVMLARNNAQFRMQIQMPGPANLAQGMA